MRKLYVNLRKPTSVVNNMTFREGKSFTAYSDPTHDLSTYIEISEFDRAVFLLRRIANENLSAVDCEKMAKRFLDEVEARDRNDSQSST